jgi:iron(III) transport system permease protein
MDGAARTLGHGPFSTLKRIHLPLMRSSILTAGILVFVDVMKELPMTMLLRPFNFETLATYVHQYASDELLEESALGALSIVIAGILPVIILSIAITRSRPGYQSGNQSENKV